MNKKTELVRLKDAFSRYGNGKIDFEVAYTRFTDFKAKWRLTPVFGTDRWSMDMKMSDYLMGASDVALDQVVQRIMDSAIRGQSNGYPKELSDFLLSKEFTDRCQPTYISRNKDIRKETPEERARLNGSLDRLASGGFIDRNDNFAVEWGSVLSGKCVYCAALMKVAVVEHRLLAMDVPDSVLDIVVLRGYRTVSALRERFLPGAGDSGRHEPALDDHPDFISAKEWLDRHSFI